MISPQEHLKNYVTEHLARLVPAEFEEGPDVPSFTVDQRSKQLEQPPYPA